MNLFKIETGNDRSDGNSDNSQLLRDIEAISKSLYLQKTPPKTSVSPYEDRSKSAERTRFINPKGPGILNDNVLPKNKKSSSLWNWKKPLKALMHIRHHSFNICFFLHVHSIEGLPANFDGISLCVQWKRKDEVLRTHPSRVSQGVSEFEETLMYKCCVYGSRTGAHNSSKYEEKLSLICASVVGTPGELEGEKSSGKWMTSFNLAGKAKGASLNVSFSFSVMKDSLVESKKNLTGSELVNLTHNSSATLESGISFASNNGNKMLRRIGSVPSNLNYRSSQSSTSVDLMVYQDVSPVLGLELSKSINFLYEKLNEGNLHGSEEFDLSSEHVEPLEPKHNLDFESTKDISEGESDCSEFTVIERGIEISEKVQLESKQNAVCTIGGSAIETINVDEIIKDDNVALAQEMECVAKESTNRSCNAEAAVNDSKREESGLSATGSMEELQSVFNGLLMSEMADLESSSAAHEFLEHQNYVKVKSNYRAGKMSKKSLSLDDVTESVASEFLNMLGMEHTPFVSSSDGDPKSPRERLLREFEKEALASGNFILGFDTREDQVECSCSPSVSGCGGPYNDFDVFPLVRGAEKENNREGLLLKNRRPANMLEDLETESLMREWGLNERAFQRSPHHQSDGFGSPIELPTEDPFELPPIADGFGPLVQIKGGGYLRSMNPKLFRDAKNVGTLIMQVSRPVVLPAEMGSDIIDVLQHLAATGIKKLTMQTNKLMPLEDITGKTLQKVAQEAAPRTVVSERFVSTSSVLSYEGFLISIFLYMFMFFSLICLKCQHVSYCFHRQSLPRCESLFGKDSYVRREEDKEFRFDRNYYNTRTGLIAGEMGPGCVSLEDFSSLAIDSIEALSIEGLRIQSGMSNEEAPSSVRTQSVGEKSPFEWKNAGFVRILSSEGAAGLQVQDVSSGANDVVELMDFSITLDEWSKLDGGIIGDEDPISEHTIKILAAHHAKCIDLVSGTLTRHLDWYKTSGKTHGLLGNNLTIAHTVLLRDPLRNYEPIGTSMLALFQVKRTFVPVKPDIYSTVLIRYEEEDQEADIKGEISDKRTEEEKVEEEEGTPWFKFSEVHLAGLKTELYHLWGSKAQQQSGIRWLLASGMGESGKHPFSKSKAIVRSYPQGTQKMTQEDVLWSITSDFHDGGANWKELEALIPHIRNPDVIFPYGSTEITL
ncbi:hypothetical protein JRO89_XS03G0292900 [Xanthoceras sorbifolium]|uniref:C2 NT-type domain-containing protein n=1 Tax=Xanthoceras sorbifolium TaxID=99658 RepID=A0ABQ8ICS3_9ROSI|nr:hypothetical protein JRO89_XS03G0292900 [Xanthoceras sorbifolium]